MGLKEIRESVVAPAIDAVQRNPVAALAVNAKDMARAISDSPGAAQRRHRGEAHRHAPVRRNDLPRCFPSDSTCWRRQDAWTRAGVWDAVHRVILEELAAAGRLDTSELFADATFAEDRKGGRAPAAPGAASG